MRVSRFRIFLLEVPLGGRVYNPRIVWRRKQSVLVLIECDQGFVGWGECWTFDASADALIRFLQTELRPAVLGRDIPSVEAFWDEVWAGTALSGRHGMTAAGLAGIEIALRDIESKRTGQPLGTVLASDPPRKQIPVYASGGLYRADSEPGKLAEELAGYVAKGFRRVKMKIGALDFESDAARVRAARQAIGADTGLIVDAVYSLDRNAAARWLPIWRDCRVEAVQAPFPAQRWEDMRWLNRDHGVPVMAFEAESRIEIFRRVVEIGALGVLQFSPIAVGGVTPAKRLIALARDAGIPVSLQCSSTWLAQTICFQIARGHDTVTHVEFHTLHQGLFNAADPAARAPRDGAIALTEMPGLGFAPPLHALRDADRTLPDLTREEKRATAPGLVPFSVADGTEGPEATKTERERLA